MSLTGYIGCARRWRRPFALACWSLFLLISKAQSAELSQYHSRNWQTDSGLPKNTVQAVVQTKDGYLWVGTQNGLARFDGVRFTVFTRRNVPEMPNQNILGLREARDGSLWIATGTGGVVRLKNGVFTHYGKDEGLGHNFTLGPILEAPEGVIWVGTMGGLSRFKDGKFMNFDTRNGLSDNVVRDLCEDQQGTIWIASGHGIDQWKDEGVIRMAPLTESIKGMDVRAICCDNDGAIWIGAGNELHRVHEGKHTAFQQGTKLPYNIIRRVYPDRQGNLWVGSYGGLSRFVDGKFVTQTGSDGLPFDFVTGIFEDREENVWVGSRDGLTQFRTKRIMTYTAQQGLPNNNVMSVLEDRNGTVWVGTWGGGLTEIKDGVSTIYTNQGPVPVFALALREDHAGRIWTGTDYAGELFRLDGQAIKRFASNQGLPARAIRVIYEDSQTNLWVGTSHGLYLGKNGRFRAFGDDQELKEGIVREVKEDHNGNLWVATEQGLWRFKNNKGQKFTTRDGLSDNVVIALYEDQSGDMWIGTAGGGMDRLHDGKFTAFTTTNGLFYDTICEIIEDDRGWFWMSCPKGIFRVSRQDFQDCSRGATGHITSIAYGKGDGMVSEMCNGVAKPGAWKSRDGRLWFATSKGASVIDPSAKVHEDRSPPSVVIERVLADKQPNPENETLAVPAPVRVRPGRGELEFYYTTLSFRAPERNRFKYKLEGVNPDWVEAGTRRVAVYHNLGPGTYHFRVLASNSNGIWNEEGAMAEIILLPHIWQTAWFRVGIACGVGLIFFGIHRFRLGRYREIERLRLRLAADLHDDVGSNLSTISLLSRRAQKQHAQGQPSNEDLSAINRIAGQTANAVREIVWFINPEYDTMQDLVLRMKEAAGSILAGIEWQFQSPPADLSQKLTLQFRQNLFLLYKEAITNVARHSQATRADVNIERDGQGWKLTVRDNGVGLDPEGSHNGNGLKNLRLRALKLNGELAVESRPGQGATIIFSTKHF